MSKNHVHIKTATAQKVMDRLKEENQWVLPVHEHDKKSSNVWRTTSIIVIILFLVGISISFLFLNPTSTNEALPLTNHENIVTLIKSTDFAKTYSNLNFSIIHEGTVAGIGEPLIYQPDEKRKNRVQLIGILGILGLSMITLFLSWLSREVNDSNSDHT